METEEVAFLQSDVRFGRTAGSHSPVADRSLSAQGLTAFGGLRANQQDPRYTVNRCQHIDICLIMMVSKAYVYRLISLSL